MSITRFAAGARGAATSGPRAASSVKIFYSFAPDPTPTPRAGSFKIIFENKGLSATAPVGAGSAGVNFFYTALF